MPIHYNTAVLTRDKSRTDGTAGKMVLSNSKGQRLVQDTLELTDLQNKPNISCVPCGAYLCKLTLSNTFGRWLYILIDVEGRSGIRFHRGNWAGMKEKDLKSDILGCILQGYGMAYDYSTYQQMVSNSTQAENDMIKFFDKQDFILVIQ